MSWKSTRSSSPCAPIDPLAAQSQSGMIVIGLQGEYTLAENAWTLHRLSGRMMGGVIEGSGSIARNDEGIHRARLVWNGIRPQILNLDWLPHTVTTSTTGQLDLSAPATSVSQIDGIVQMRIAEILVGEANVGHLDISSDFKQGSVKMVGEGRVFGGVAGLELSAADFSGRDLSGKATVNTMQVNELTRLLGPAVEPPSWRRLGDG